jgi:transcriptional regulator with XRE-family HTH domain
VTVGEALAQARRQAGLSVAQVSQKTRIRQAIIRDIERDDYSALGADFYARGHIRAMARAIGVDSEALVRRYDAARSAGAPVAGEQLTRERFGGTGEPAAAEEFGPDGFAAPEEYGAPDDFGPEQYRPGGSAPPDQPGPEIPGGFAPPEEFAPGGFAASEEFAPGGFAAPDYPGTAGFAAPDEGELIPPGESAAPEEITAPNRVLRSSQMATFEDIMASDPAAAPEGTVPPRSRPPGPARPAQESRPGRPDRIVITAVVLALAIFGGLAYLLVAGTRSTPQAGAAAATGQAGHHRAASGRRHQGATTSPSATPRSAPPAVLTPARAVAFGPGGPAHGDDPLGASLAIDRSRRTAWQTDWYTTSHFGGLKAGTGLLLDMGHRVTITSARIKLGAVPGADLQLRAGAPATLAGLRPVASAANAHGTIRLRPATPVRARYVLIWFTQLPPDPAGTYQVNVFNVRLR